MVEEEKSEKKVTVKEKPLGGTKVEATETKQVTEQPSTGAQPSRAGDVASKGGEAIGKGLKKVAGVVGEFTAGVSKEMKTGEAPKQEPQVQEAQQTEYRSEEREMIQEAPRAKVTEKEKVEKKVTKEKE